MKCNKFIHFRIGSHPESSPPGLAVNGRIDRATWQALSAGDTQPFATYAVSAADIDGPYAPIPADMMERA